MPNWMNALASKYQKSRTQYPDKKLMIVFDIDGTILDMRYAIWHLLKSFDENHATNFFEDLKIGDITAHGNQVATLFPGLNIPLENQPEILEWYNCYRWSSEAVLRSHRPFAGVMEVIRWFQMQPNTYVGLNTGRPEIIRLDTLRSLNKLGKACKVRFANDLLFMNPYGWEEHVAEVKVAGIKHFKKAGYHVFAMVDNEPENLNAVSKTDTRQEILLLHADTILATQRKRLPGYSVSGSCYDLTDLIFEPPLLQHIHFVWHGVNDEDNFRQFLSSPIQWAQCSVRLEPATHKIVLRNDSFQKLPLKRNEELIYLHEVMDFFNAMGRSLKLNLKENGRLLDELDAMLKYNNVGHSRLWFSAKIDILGEDGFRRLRTLYPMAILQCPVDHLISQILNDPKRAADSFKGLTEWGINRFSIQWHPNHLKRLLEYMDRLGIEANVCRVPNLESFFKTVLLRPRSITADFNFSRRCCFPKKSGDKFQHAEFNNTRVSLSV